MIRKRVKLFLFELLYSRTTFGYFGQDIFNHPLSSVFIYMSTWRNFTYYWKSNLTCTYCSGRWEKQGRICSQEGTSGREGWPCQGRESIEAARACRNRRHWQHRLVQDNSCNRCLQWITATTHWRWLHQKQPGERSVFRQLLLLFAVERSLTCPCALNHNNNEIATWRHAAASRCQPCHPGTMSSWLDVIVSSYILSG